MPIPMSISGVVPVPVPIFHFCPQACPQLLPSAHPHVHLRGGAQPHSCPPFLSPSLSPAPSWCPFPSQVRPPQVTHETRLRHQPHAWSGGVLCCPMAGSWHVGHAPRCVGGNPTALCLSMAHATQPVGDVPTTPWLPHGDVPPHRYRCRALP